MRTQLSNWTDERTLFFTSGNLPTQEAYGLTHDDVLNAFVVALLRSERVLLAASFYFESPATRSLVRRFPSVWHSGNEGATFFINTAYPTIVDHGLGKVEKSPSSFDPYSSLELVRRRGATLDNLGHVVVRDDVDMSAALANSWIRSCLSAEDQTVGDILRRHVEPSRLNDAIVTCANVAERRQQDFIWPAIELEIRSYSFLSGCYQELRRRHADLYAEIMSVALGAVETTPVLSLTRTTLTDRGLGHLGRFSTVLRRVGIDPRSIREDFQLRELLHLDELSLLRSLDDEILAAALELQQSASNFWRAISLSEERQLSGPRLSDADIRQAVTAACDAVGVTPHSALVTRISSVQRLYGGAFLRHFRDRVQELLERRIQSDGSTLKPPSARIGLQDVVLFAAADPNIGGPMMRLETDLELKAIENAIETFGDRSAIRVQFLSAVEIHELQPALLTHSPKVFHFSGHGDAEGRIFLQAAQGGRIAVTIQSLVEALGLIPFPPECAVFHSCYSLSALSHVGPARVRYLILASGKIADVAARAFSGSFYLTLAAGLGLLQAFSTARARLRMESADADLLQLYERVDKPAVAPRDGDAAVPQQPVFYSRVM